MDDITTPDISIAYKAYKARLARETTETRSTAQLEPTEPEACNARKDHHEAQAFDFAPLPNENFPRWKLYEPKAESEHHEARALGFTPIRECEYIARWKPDESKAHVVESKHHEMQTFGFTPIHEYLARWKQDPSTAHDAESKHHESQAGAEPKQNEYLPRWKPDASNARDAGSQYRVSHAFGFRPIQNEGPAQSEANTSTAHDTESGHYESQASTEPIQSKHLPQWKPNESKAHNAESEHHGSKACGAEPIQNECLPRWKPDESKAHHVESEHDGSEAYGTESTQKDMRDYQAYDFTMENLSPLFAAIAKVKDAKRSIVGYVAKVEALQNEWGRMYSDNCKILDQNLKCLECSYCDEGPSSITNSAFKDSMRRIKALNRKQDPLGITKKTLAEAEKDFFQFEDRFLDLHEESGCKKLEGVRELATHLRAQQKLTKNPVLPEQHLPTPPVPLPRIAVPRLAAPAPKAPPQTRDSVQIERHPPTYAAISQNDSGVKPSPQIKDSARVESYPSIPAVLSQNASAPEEIPQVRDSNCFEPLAKLGTKTKSINHAARLRENKKKANLAVQQKTNLKPIPPPNNTSTPAPKFKPRPSDGNYTQYNLKIDPLSAVQNLVEKDEELVRETWVAMYKEANRIWMYNMTCPECKKAPGDSQVKHKFKAALTKYGQTMDAFLDADPNTLTQGDLNAFIRAMYAMEDMYLEDNWDSKCRGFLGLKEKIDGYRERV